MKYIVLTSQSTFELEKVVNEHISHGWIPTGGVTVQGQHPYFYYQSMIKQPND